jgi:hypothetical protein
LFEDRKATEIHDDLYAHALVLDSNGRRVALPGDTFVEIGLAIKAASPLARTLVAAYANGYVGYLCTDKALAEGSYETWAARSSLPAAGAEGREREAAGAALRAVVPASATMSTR